MPLYGNGFHVPNDPTRTAALQMMSRPSPAQPTPTPGAAPVGGGGSLGRILAQATAILTQEGLTPANRTALDQFAGLLQKLAEPFMAQGQQGAGVPPPADFGSLPSRSAQAASPFKGPMG